MKRLPGRNGRNRAPVLITGGAGFIGANLAHRLASAGRQIIIYDNLSRPGAERNLAWLKATHGDRIEEMVADIRDRDPLEATVHRAAQVFHFAAQVAVTTSLDDPVADFDVNLRGTLNLLEAVRGAAVPPPVVFTSTNKVYGTLEDVALVARESRYAPVAAMHREGIDERRALDFHSPYGCSKGAADQYILDYARSYGIAAVVFRMSCIYGPHQNGTEDQGWVAHFLLRALAGEPIAIYGDGRQVRDVLHIDDLVTALLRAQEEMPRISGNAFNIGGGAANAISLLELIATIGRLSGRKPQLGFGAWRTGDQRYYVSNHGKFSAATGWTPKWTAEQGIAQLYDWLLAERRGGARSSAPSEKPRAASGPLGIPAMDTVGAS